MANGLYDLYFIVCSGAGGFNFVSGVITNTATPVSNGLFNVALDFGPGIFDGSDRWLLIFLRTNGVGEFTTLSPRQPITATPYATRAANFSGIVSDSQLSTNVARLNANQTFSGTVIFNSQSNSYTGSGAGLTNLPGVLLWQVVAGMNQQAQANRGYIVTNANQVTITLPPAPNIGDTIRVSGVGAGGWKIAQNAGQSILAASLSWIGENWTPRESSRFWLSVASSASGRILVATAAGGKIFVSTDSGVNWTADYTYTITNYYGVASSSDGSKLVATVSGGQIYTSADSGKVGRRTQAAIVGLGSRPRPMAANWSRRLMVDRFTPPPIQARTGRRATAAEHGAESHLRPMGTS